MASAPDARARHARYLQALTGLNPHHAHDLRGRLGSVALHLEVAAELLAGDGDVAPAAIGRVRSEVGRARTSLREVLGALEALLGLTRPPATSQPRFDLREMVRDLEASLAPVLRDRKLEWNARVGEPPAIVAGEQEALRQALIIAIVDILVGLAPGGRVELSVAPAADRVELGIAGVPAAGGPRTPVPAALETEGDPLEILRSTLESSGGGARTDGAARFVLTLPLASPSA